jgi:DNA-binding beta-propeller fold protein YncE
MKVPADQVGLVLGVAIAPNDHVWIIHSPSMVVPGRPSGPEDMAKLLPPVIELDERGEFIQAWGGPDHLPKVDGVAQWCAFEEAITVDSEGMIWVFGANRPHDHCAQRFSPSGELLLRIGKFGVPGNDESTDLLGAPTAVYVDPISREAFFSDGYTNHRIVSFNVDTGEFIRSWGAYGKAPSANQGRDSFAPPVHQISRGPDGYLYVCDRLNNRIQVFDAVGREDVEFVREIDIAPRTLFVGAAFDTVWSPDGKYMYVPDGTNNRIWIVDMTAWRVRGFFGGRESGTENIPGIFSYPHRVAIDREGNILAAHIDGLDRHIFQGIS